VSLIDLRSRTRSSKKCRSEVMRQDQLDKARQSRWRQDGNALLTLDDAERWLAETPLCLYLPRRQHLPVPAPSFVEAIAGRPDATPGPEHIEAAARMLSRLVASGAVIALNLFGAAPGIGVSTFVGEHPDFLATPEALPYLYAMQPERNPKRPPTTVGGARVSPLAAEAYTLLEREGALTTSELRSRLGREVTEAAVLRSLAELWHTMRVVPVPAENPQQGAHWELLSARHRRELNIGSTQSQTTALSVLVSFYLQSAIAATAEEVEIFLSPLASRSRIRDVVHGLSTTRQLASFSLEGDEHFYVEGTLPEVAEEQPAVALVATIGADAASLDAGLEQNEPDLTEAAAANPPELTRQRPRAPRPGPRPSFRDRARRSFAAQDRRGPSGDRPPRREGGFRPPQRSTGRSSDRGFDRRSGSGSEGRSDRGFDRSSERGPDRSFERSSQRGNFRRSEGAEGASRRPSSDFERRPRSGGPERPKRFGPPPGAPDRSERGSFSRGSFSKDRFRKPGGFSSPKRRFDEERPPRPAGGNFRRDKRSDDRDATERRRFRPEAGGPSSRFEKNRPGRPPARGGTRPPRDFRSPGGDTEGRSGLRPDRSSRPERSSRPDRPFGKPQSFRKQEDRRAAGSRSFEGRPPRRDESSRPQGDRPFKRPYSPAGDRPERRPERRSDASGNFRPRREGGDREPRPFRAGGQRPNRSGGFRNPAGRSGSFGKPYRKRPDNRSGAPETGADRPRSPRPAFDKGPRPGGRKPYGKPGGRPPAKGGFKPGGFNSGTKRPGGKKSAIAPPRRKPRGESEQGNES
jgi:23S rRNA pseudouridine2605 synthase